ncbi:hypothetical protein ACS5NO_31955 [Larkinella sp. GY13]|uniref:hypothetical protein n=1 Tax=Larkinella sp. GY13 TaxID=3453720 RepID=UPI003EEB11E6
MKTAIKHTLAIIALFTSTLVAQAQVKIGTNPTVAAPTSNLEVEASTPNRKVKVDKTTGQLTIQDGTEGTGKILTSDAVGGASWQLPYSTTVITGLSSPPLGAYINPPTVTEYIANSPLTLNKGVYTLFYYAQFDYLQPSTTSTPLYPDPTNFSTLANTLPQYIYFEFITESGSATFPSYLWGTTGQPDGPHVIPVINFSQVAAKVTQLVIVNADNTVIKPKYWGIPRYGHISNIGPIIALKM